MALIKKIDVKNYLSARKRNGLRPYRPASQPDATGFSGEPSRRADSEASTSTLDPSSASGMHASQIGTQIDSGQAVPPATSKSVQG